MTALNPDPQTRFSLLFVIACSSLIALFSMQFWGYWPHNINFREINVVGEMIQNGLLDHPLKNYYRLLPANTMFEPDLIRTPVFNFIAGFLTQFFRVIFSFFILRFLIQNDAVILLIICFLGIGLAIEPPSYFLTIKHPSFYNFRQIASIFVLFTTLLMLHRRWVFAGIALGVAYFFHPKVGAMSLLILGGTVTLGGCLRTGSLYRMFLDITKFLIPAVIIIIGVTSYFYGQYFDESMGEFPVYALTVKADPDDFFFFDYYANLAPTMFQAFGWKRFVLGLTILAFLLLAKLFVAGSKDKTLRDPELILLATIYLFLLYMARFSPEVNLFLGLLNMIYFVKVFPRFDRTNHWIEIVRSPIGVFTLVVTALFLAAVGMEYIIGYIPGAIGPLIYNWKIWGALHFNTYIGSVIMFVVLGRIASSTIVRYLPEKAKVFSVHAGLSLVLILLVSLSMFVSRDHGNRGLLTQLDIYTWLKTKDEDKNHRPSMSQNESAYVERRIISDISEQKLDLASQEFRAINWDLVIGNIDDAEKRLSKIRKFESPYLNMLHHNAIANLKSIRGNLHLAYRMYLDAELEFQPDDNEYPVSSGGRLGMRFPSTIPNMAFSEATKWIRENTKQEAYFLNAPYLNGFSLATKRSAFFPNPKFESESTATYPAWTNEYLHRQHDILGLTLLDLPGITHGSLKVAQVRYAFLALDGRRIDEIKEKYKNISFIFTEVGHDLPYDVAYSNEYLLVYKI